MSLHPLKYSRTPKKLHPNNFLILFPTFSLSWVPFDMIVRRLYGMQLNGNNRSPYMPVNSFSSSDFGLSAALLLPSTTQAALT
ncbi:hypothetical protein BDZ97DRAFT_2057715, partial [Flammula alnicola]